MIIRGTDIPASFDFPFDIEEIDVLYITFSQKDDVIFEIEKDRCSVRDGYLFTSITQEETLKLDDMYPVEIQIRGKNIAGKAFSSNIMNDSVGRILKDGMI